MKGRASVLVVDGETPSAMHMVHVLSSAGFDVHAAANGRKGLELASDRRFDLILLSTELPDTDGLDLCRELKQRHICQCTPILLIAASPDAESRRRGLEAGAAVVTARPLSANRLLSLAAQTLGEARQRPGTRLWSLSPAG